MSAWLAVIFDLDDTLYPEVEFVRGGLRAVSQEVESLLGIPRLTVRNELHTLLQTSPRGKLIDAWLEQRQLAEPALLARLLQAYREHPPEIQLHPGLRELLTDLRVYRRLGIVSDGWLFVQQRKFRALGVEHLFDAVVFSDQWGREFWKPHRRPFEAVLARLGCEPSAAVYVGDNPAKDFIGCRALGISTIQLRLPSGVYGDVVPETSEHAADWVVTSIEGLREALGA